MTRYLFLLLLLCTGVSAQAQQTPEDQARDDLDYYKDGDRQRDRDRRGSGDLWYGAGGQLAFTGGGFSSLFTVGLSPIVGYKVNNFLSVGPRGAFAYNAYREDLGGGQRFKANFVTWEAGLFTRARIINPVFAHVEYSLLSEADRVDANGDVSRTTRAIPFAGGGISQGGGPGAVGFEILLLVRLSQAERINDSPVVFRTGLNYNF